MARSRSSRPRPRSPIMGGHLPLSSFVTAVRAGAPPAERRPPRAQTIFSSVSIDWQQQLPIAAQAVDRAAFWPIRSTLQRAPPPLSAAPKSTLQVVLAVGRRAGSSSTTPCQAVPWQAHPRFTRWNLMAMVQAVRPREPIPVPFATTPMEPLPRPFRAPNRAPNQGRACGAGALNNAPAPRPLYSALQPG